MAEISFIGLGLMGATLAETTIKAGFKTAVWNRTACKAETLAALGALNPPSAAEAIMASPITVVCLGSYDAATALLHSAECTNAAKDRTIIQLTTGSPQLARAGKAWADGAGAAYLDGGILAMPEDIGTAKARFLLSGDEAGYQKAAPYLRAMAPTIEYLGSDPAKASAMDLALLSGTFGLIFGLLNGAAIAEASNVSIKSYVDLARPILTGDLGFIGESAIKCEEDTMEDTEAFLSTWAEGLTPMISALKSAGYSAEIPAFMQATLHRAAEQGYGEQDIAALIKLLRPPSHR